jgi:hypothetical protein
MPIRGPATSERARVAEHVFASCRGSIAPVDDPGLAAEECRAGAARVRERFLVTRVVRDLLGLLG